MTRTQESRPGGETRAAEDLAGSAPILPVVPGQPSKLIGASVETALDATLWQLVTGVIESWQLTPALAAWWNVAFAAGARSVQPDLDQARADADRYYELAMNPGKKLSDMKQRRIDIAIAEADRNGTLTTEADVVRTIIAACEPRGGAR